APALPASTAPSRKDIWANSSSWASSPRIASPTPHPSPSPTTPPLCLISPALSILPPCPAMPLHRSITSALPCSDSLALHICHHSFPPPSHTLPASPPTPRRSPL